MAALAFILYGTVLELNYYGVVQSYCTTHPELKTLQAIILVNLFAYLAVAYLAGLLARSCARLGPIEGRQWRAGKSQVLHENIIQSISSGLITTGLDGHITLVNSAAQKLSGKHRPVSYWETRSSNVFLDPLPSAESHQSPCRSSI